jgi:hypothetical protein
MRLFMTGLVVGAAMALASSATLAATAVGLNQSAALSAPYAAMGTTLQAGASWQSPALTPGVVSGSVSGVYRSPFEGGPIGASYFNVSATSTAVLNVGSYQTGFKFLLGSPDSYNQVEFWNTATNTFVSIRDAAVTFVGGIGAIQTGLGAYLVTVTGLYFDQVKFYNSPNTESFEFAAIAAVPLPAGLPLLGAGVALLGLLGWRRKGTTISA